MFLQVQPLDDAASPPLPSSEMVIVMATVVSKLIDEDARDNVTKFCALTPPAISVRSYLERIGQYADCSPGCFVLSMVYIDRLGMRLSPLINYGGLRRVEVSGRLVLPEQLLRAARRHSLGGAESTGGGVPLLAELLAARLARGVRPLLRGVEAAERVLIVEASRRWRLVMPPRPAPTED